MRSLLATVISLAILCGLPAVTARAEPPKKQIKLRLCILEGAPTKPGEGAEIDTLSRLTVVALDEQIAIVSIGQVVQGVECGQTVKLVPSLLRDGRIRVKVSAVSVAPKKPKNGKVQFEAHSSYGVVTVEPGIRGGFVFGRGPGGKKVWVEFHASVMPR